MPNLAGRPRERRQPNRNKKKNMSGSLVLLYLAGAVALLLYATRMVRTGVERAYGDVLRRRLRSTLRNPLPPSWRAPGLPWRCRARPPSACWSVPSSGSGIVGGAAGLIAVLGADLGSALVVKILTFDLTIVPICLFLGTAIFLATERREWRQFGRILVGIGLLILSLQLIGEASEPLRESALLPVIVNYLAGDPVTAFLLAALVTWLFHSSVASDPASGRACRRAGWCRSKSAWSWCWGPISAAG
jgi:phosphate:Na+ symporter